MKKIAIKLDCNGLYFDRKRFLKLNEISSKGIYRLAIAMALF